MKYGSGTYFVFSFDYVKQDWSAGQHKGHFDLSNIKEEEQFLWNVFFDVLLCEISWVSSNINYNKMYVNM